MNFLTRTKRWFLPGAAIVLFTSGINSRESSTNEQLFARQHPGFTEALEHKAVALFRDYQLQGDFLFAVVNENGLAYSLALNPNILEGKPSDLTNDSPIYVASHTKSFTGTLLKMLEQQHKIDLNKTLADYLPELNFGDSIDTRTIAVRSLLNHTHGFFSTPFTWKTAFLGYEGGHAELIHDLNTDFLYDASHKFRYSNVGPIVTAMIAEKVSDKSWKESMKEQIFIPLKMEHTSAYVSDFDLQTIRPSLTVSGSRGIIESGFYKEDITMHASGGIISSINDLSKWLRANINEDEILLNKSFWADLHQATTTQNKKYYTYQRNGYSLGWDIADYQGQTILTRFGGLAGISFHISFMPEQKLGIIAFSTDNRAYLLPHLMANYAYNLILEQTADSLFEIEKQGFNKSFQRENQLSYPEDSDKVRGNPQQDAWVCLPAI